MAAHVPKPPGYLQMLTSGARYFSGLEEVVFRNIEACKELAQSLQATYGPSGLNKLVVNHLEKLLVTGDSSTVLREYQIEHPAANMLVLAMKMQEEEVGDGRTLVLLLAGSLLDRAGSLLRSGLSVPEVIEGYRQGCQRALEVLEELTCGRLDDPLDEDAVADTVRTPIMSKQCGYEGTLSRLVARSCVVVSSGGHGVFDPDLVRVCKVLGAGVGDSLVLGGMAFKKEAESLVTSVRDARVVVYSCPFELSRPETKGTVLLQGPADMLGFGDGEERLMEAQVRGLLQAGVTVLVIGGKVGELALHYADQHRLMVVRLHSRHELSRLAKAVGATPLLKLGTPSQEELGHCDRVYLQEVGGTQLVIFEQEKRAPAVATILLRGPLHGLQDQLEEAIRDGVSTYRSLGLDSRLVPGAGATEVELALQISAHGASCPGLEQYAIQEYARSFQDISEALVRNTGDRERQVITQLLAAHQEGHRNLGFNMEPGDAEVLDAAKAGIWDSLLVKRSAIRLATNAAITVLSVDQIIMAKKSGGPKPRGENPNWDEPSDHID
ncbi:T-complex protein 1 subunit theta-like [Hemiscyllium ocellatum]|uniref:T-complex protein 1 subunit theta-like n=1 Tax=Hemiscyllium ocellatum TaxID=170820 RepID=UPI002965DAA9|nr:T-complex protein 1 subunit theta-like [Hemiscyllium ocellatum]